MSIKESQEKIKSLPVASSEYIEEDFEIVPVGATQPQFSPRRHLLNGALIVLLASASFGLGRITLYEESRVPVRIIPPETGFLKAEDPLGQAGEVKGASAEKRDSGEVVASKSGKKYHFPWCAGAKQISQKNKIAFPSFDDARKAGYTPASNCKGLK